MRSGSIPNCLRSFLASVRGGLAVGVLSLAACTRQPATAVSAFTIDSVATLEEGDSAQLRLTTIDGSDVPQAQWTSSDPSVIEVLDAGSVLARGPGTAIVAVVAGSRSAQTQITVRRPPLPDLYVVAHRGFAGVFPENTLTAVNGAYDRGADAVEVDVMMARDRVPIIMHDDKVDRTTNGTGLVSSFTSDQLQQLDACTKFGSKWSPCPVPLAREVMEAAKDRGRLLLHLKGPWPAGAIDTLLRLVRSEGIRHQTVVIDFDTLTLKHVRRVDPGITVGLLTMGMVDPALMNRLGNAVALLYDSTFVSAPRAQIAALRSNALEQGNALGAWTIYGLMRAKQLRGSGAGWMITDVELSKDTLSLVPMP